MSKGRALSRLVSSLKNTRCHFSSQTLISISFLSAFSGDDHAVSSLQNAAVEVIGTLARATGEDNFRPYAHQSIELGLRMLNSALDDPETAKVTYFYKSTWILLDISLKIRMDFTQISCAHFLHNVNWNAWYVNEAGVWYITVTLYSIK